MARKTYSKKKTTKKTSSGSSRSKSSQSKAQLKSFMAAILGEEIHDEQDTKNKSPKRRANL